MNNWTKFYQEALSNGLIHEDAWHRANHLYREDLEKQEILKRSIELEEGLYLIDADTPESEVDYLSDEFVTVQSKLRSLGA